MPTTTTHSSPPQKRHHYRARVVQNQWLCDEHYLLRLRISAKENALPFPDTKPGQFIQLGCSDVTSCSPNPVSIHEWQDDAGAPFPQISPSEFTQKQAFLRRPFSLAGHQTHTEAGTRVDDIDIIHRVVGIGTQWLADRKNEDPIDLIGPLGNWFEIEKPADKTVPKRALLVGGGVGLPPMLYLAEALIKSGWQACAFVGAMRKSLLPVSWTNLSPDPNGKALLSVKHFAELNVPSVVTTDDGSLGLKGRITDGLDRYLETLKSKSEHTHLTIFTCGPGPMMAAVYKIAQAHGIAVQACVEQAMACGMGTCQSCIVKGITKPGEAAHGQISQNGSSGSDINWRYRLACHDGPVFQAEDLIW